MVKIKALELGLHEGHELSVRNLAVLVGVHQFQQLHSFTPSGEAATTLGAFGVDAGLGARTAAGADCAAATTVLDAAANAKSAAARTAVREFVLMESMVFLLGLDQS